MRLDKLLGQEGLGTRSELKKAIRAGRAAVNGIPEKDPGRQVTEADEVFFYGKRVGRTQFVYYMLHKPAGVITATEDSRERTVLDLLREPAFLWKDNTAELPEEPAGKKSDVPGPEPVLRKGLFPVGRLDRDTEGLLLITDDGQLAHRLLSPKKHVDKTYYAVVTGQVSEDDIRRFEEGLRLGSGDSPDSFTALPAILRVAGKGGSGKEGFGKEGPGIEGSGKEGPGIEGSGKEGPGIEGSGKEGTGIKGSDEAGGAQTGLFGILPPGVTDYTETLVTIREGKFHQIKRMFAAVGKEVLYLKRLSMGPLRLDPALAPGEFRELTEEEKALLFQD